MDVDRNSVGLAVRFFVVPNLGRVMLVVSIVLICLFLPDVLRSPAAATLSSAVGTLRTYNEYLQSYKAAHPQGGYPLQSPNIHLDARVKRSFKFNYVPSRSAPSGPNDGFRIELMSLDPCCTGSRSFTAFEDGIIRYRNNDAQPPARTDAPL